MDTTPKRVLPYAEERSSVVTQSTPTSPISSQAPHLKPAFHRRAVTWGDTPSPRLLASSISAATTPATAPEVPPRAPDASASASATASTSTAASLESQTPPADTISISRTAEPLQRTRRDSWLSLSLITGMARGTSALPELPPSYCTFHWRCCRETWNWGLKKPLRKKRCGTQNRVLKPTCTKCRHRACSSCEKYAMTQEDLDALSREADQDATEKGKGKGTDVGERRPSGVFLPGWGTPAAPGSPGTS
ncbi:hypothetical protein LZ554_004742 [Drepanopeziza brunnea f. sp. 'monogermtubi']|nr:hypothetical protein LZ554_004742 [Drepanopeziza brunnea f. sp. 'monogermtubi']